jgi:PAS domain S-box-containing protein
MFKPVDPMVLSCKVAVFVDLHRKGEEIRREAAARERLMAEILRARTEKLLAEQALRRSEERQSLALRTLPIVLYSAEAMDRGRLVYVSDSAGEVLGHHPSRFLDDPGLWAGGIHPEDRARVRAGFDAIFRTGSITTEYRWRAPDGGWRHVLDQATLVPAEGVRPPELVGTILDVTETRQMQQQLVHAQKMETVGQLTGGIAHDFNNMLMVVIGSLDRLGRMLKGDADASKRIDMAMQASLRCADMTRRLLAFARRQQLNPEPVDVGELALGMGDLIERTLGGRIELVIDGPGAMPARLATIDRSQAESALLNLVINARDAMPDGGTLRISTALARFDERQAAHGIEAGPGDYVVLSVTDTGCGMSGELIGHIFEPFFTTKEIGKGTGLGLSMIYGFVKQSGGLVRVDSEPGRGTAFHLFLPRAALAEGPAPAPGEETAEGGDGEVVLVVDDDQDVRRVTASTLRELGYAVVEAEGGRHALDILAGDGPVDLLFTDVLMPGGMNGRELARRASERRPGLKVLYASGCASHRLDGEVPASIAGQVLEKPYRDRDLALAVSRALRAAPPLPRTSPEDEAGA